MTEARPAQRIVVTGGAGFIGSHTVVALHEAGYVRSSWMTFATAMNPCWTASAPWWARWNFTASIAAMRTPWLPCLNRPVLGAIHFAADKAVGESVAHPEKYFDNNVGGTARFTALLRRHGVKHLVFSSSCTVYGEAEAPPVAEDAPILPAASPYGYTKQACEDFLRMAHGAAEGDLGVALLRYFNPIGAHPSAHIGELPLGLPPNLVPYLIQAVAGSKDR